MSNINEQPRPSIGGHGKFVFRQGWLKKGFDVIHNDPLGFTKEDSYIQLGVGKVMAESIRYWCQAFDLVEDTQTKEGKAYHPTTFGNLIFAEDGIDPYLEHDGTLWLLHWRLTRNRSRGYLNHILFSKLYEIEFKKLHLFELIHKELPRVGVNTTDKMVQREVDILLRTYVPNRAGGKVSIEESLDCPLADLNLIQYIDSDDLYRFRVGPKTTLPQNVFEFAFAEFAEDVLENNRTTIAIDEFMYQENSPGQIFKLDENSVVGYIERIIEKYPNAIQLTETAGLNQVFIKDRSALEPLRAQIEGVPCSQPALL